MKFRAATLKKYVKKSRAHFSKSLVVFTPSGKRGHFEKGTSILQIARKLGVDLDSVCGGRGICSKCQITPSYGEFTNHGVTVSADALSEWN